MAYNAPGDDFRESEASPNWIKPIIIAFVAAFIILVGVFFALTMLDPSKPGRAASSDGTASSTFSENFLKSFMPVFRDSCVKSAHAALTQHGADLSADSVGTEIEAYCTCATNHTASDLTVPDLVAFRLNPASEPAASKMKNIIQECQATMGSIGR